MSASPTLQVACVQLEIGDEPKAERLDRARSMLEQARGSDLVLLPEL